MTERMDLEALRPQLEEERDTLRAEIEEKTTRLEQVEAVLTAMNGGKKKGRSRRSSGKGASKEKVSQWLTEITRAGMTEAERVKAVVAKARDHGATGLNLVPRFAKELISREGGGGDSADSSSTRPPTDVREGAPRKPDLTSVTTGGTSR